MARIELSVPDTLPFHTEIAVRITDINYAGHLGNDAVLGILHEARIRFLEARGYSEKNVCGWGIILTDVAIVFRSEAFYGERLRVDVGAVDFNRYGCDIVYRLSEGSSGREVAVGKTGLVLYDYENRRVVAAPTEFRQGMS